MLYARVEKTDSLPVVLGTLLHWYRVECKLRDNTFFLPHLIL